MALGDDEEYQRAIESLGTDADDLRGLNDRVGRTERRTTRQWWFIAFDIALTVAAIVGGARLYGVGVTTQQTQAAQKASCISGNQYRAADLKRWNTIVGALVVPGRPLTPAQQAVIDRIDRENAVTDAQRNCNKVNGVG